ncbi:MAG: YceI family protein [Kiloniellales bacterium]|nr:YceI family protein [Kiloniellales bacterium]
MKLRALAAIAALCVAGAPAWAEAPDWRVEDGSRVGFIATQGGAPVEGVFETFEAQIRFDPEALDRSRVAVTIDIASVNSESKDRDDTIRSASLFDVATWPSARFEAEGFAQNGDGGYEASGRLTMRDVTRDVVLPFTLEVAPDPDQPGQLRAVAKGELKVQRLDYGVGQGLWEDTSVVGNEVVIFIDIQATRPGAN